MQAYTVYEPSDTGSDRIDRAEGLAFIKDGFSWAAFLFAPIWMLVHRLWWPLLGYIGVVVGLQLAGLAFGRDQQWLTLLALGINLLVGFEASTLRRWTLERKGWSMVGAVSGRNLDECERRFFDTWLPAQPMIATPERAAPRRAPLGSLSQLFGARS